MLLSMLIFGQNVASWVYEKAGGVVNSTTAGLGWESNGSLVSGFAIDGWNGHNLYIHQRHDKTAPPKLWFSIADYCFNKLGCSRITGIVPSDNDKAISLNKKIGFEQEAVLKKAADNGEDMIVMVLWKENCRFLDWEKRYG